MGMLKTKLAKATITGGIALAALGLGAGIAGADPGRNDHGPVPEQQHNDWQRNDQQRNDWQHNDQQPSPHGFWIFGQWIALP